MEEELINYAGVDALLDTQKPTEKEKLCYIPKKIIEGYHQAEKDIGKSLVRFFRDNITFDAYDGLIVDIPTFFDLIYECSKAIGIDLMPIYKNNC